MPAGRHIEKPTENQCAEQMHKVALRSEIIGRLTQANYPKLAAILAALEDNASESVNQAPLS
jgi:hypothetical protein